MLILIGVLDPRGIERYSQPRMKLWNKGQGQDNGRTQAGEAESRNESDTFEQLERLSTNRDSTRLPFRKFCEQPF